MDEDTFTLTLTLPELAFVIGALGASPRLLENPFAGWSVEQIKTVLQQAQESLATHEHAQVQPEGSLALDATVAALVGALAFAEAALTVTHVVGTQEQPATRQLYFASGLIVEQEQQSDKSYSLTAVRDREVVAQRLREYLRLADQPTPPLQSCTLLASDANEARCVAAVEGEKACGRVLVDAGVPAAVASSLAQAMAYPVCQSSLLALTWEGQEAQRLDGFTLVVGEQGLWLLHSLEGDGEPRLEATPCDAAYAMQQVKGLVHLVIPTIQE